MAVSGSATITAPIGPGKSATSLSISNVRTVMFDTQLASLVVTNKSGVVTQFDLNATTTITATASSGVFTFTVSQ